MVHSATHTFPWSLFPTANHHLRNSKGKAYFSHPRRSRDGTSTSKSRIVEPNYSYQTTSEAAFLEVDLPGVHNSNVTVHVEGHKLFIEGKRYTAHHNKNKDSPTAQHGNPDLIYMLEADFEHDANVLGTTVEDVNNGSLTLRVPLTTQGTRRRIQFG